VAAWHRWFFATRDPAGEGLVAIIHPWESGRDNSVDWDDPFDRVPTEGIAPYTRRDTQHADPAHRPTKAQYDRYLWLVEHFRALNWDTSKLHDASPFQVVDPGFNAILLRACADLADRLISDLSGGQTKRVLLAFCLVRPRQLLVLDEAQAGLDSQAAEQFYDLLFQLRRSEGWTILQVSHDLDMVRRTCDRVLCLNRSLRCSGPPDHALSPVQLEAVYGRGFVPYHHRHVH
jgi:ABC-type cobalamin transport system ATPase subunit